MEQLITFLTDNWYWLVPLVLTELMPFLPSKSNGILQAIISIVGAVATKSGKKTVALLVVAMLACSGCASTTTTTNSGADVTIKALATAGAALAAVPQTAKTLLEAKKITVVQYNHIAGLYRKARASYNLAVDAAEVYLKNSTDNNATILSTLMSEFVRNRSDLMAALTEFKGGTP